MRKIIARAKLYFVLMLAVLALVAWGMALGSRAVSNDSTPRRVVIARGLSANRIAEILHDNQLIRSRFTFLLTCRMNGASERLKPGVYELNRTMTVPQIIEHLVDGDSLESWITIPEGYTARQIADLIEEKRLAHGETFLGLAMAQSGDFADYPFVHGDSLEGYLFPDTYLIARGTDPELIIAKLLDAFEAKVVSPLRPEVEIVINRRLDLDAGSFPRGLHAILTMASLVEREARTDKDRPLIAGVLWNRLDRGMKLQVDATVSYVPGQSKENKDRVYYKDLENGSRYNTYKHHGLPPGPICNPGLEAIRAVLDPAETDYLYYVARDDGSHIFSRTYDQHQSAIRRVKNSSRGGGN